MTWMDKEVKARRAEEKSGAEMNYMGGISYRVNPLDTLKMVTASSIFGEPQYYRDGEHNSSGLKRDGKYAVSDLLKEYCVLPDSEKYEGKKTSEVMEDIIDNALDYDFGGTLDCAVTLRKTYNMRLNPQIILVRAASHPKRSEYMQNNPGRFAEVQAAVLLRADEPASQFAYYLYKNGSKKNLPNPLKKTWKTKLESLKAYDVAKYKNTGLGIIDVARVSHASSPVLNELMRTGTLQVEDKRKTWENLKSEGKSWKEILDTVKLGHMALLRNLRSIFMEINDTETCDRLLQQLKDGVLTGKQFPFRYYSAYNAVKADTENIHFTGKILDALEECVEISSDNMPHLSGRTMCLSDNSGSAWYNILSAYGTACTAEIDNLSSVIAAKGSDEGYVGLFGDELIIEPIGKKTGVLDKAGALSETAINKIGKATENGIWLFFSEAIREKQYWDNIFIFSDQQAGHGGLYGTDEEVENYSKQGYAVNGRFIDAAKLAEKYRKEVNPKVNIFSVQTAGYTNILIPEYMYRGNCLYGWTGKELVFADEMIRFWDEQDRKNGGNEASRG